MVFKCVKLLSKHSSEELPGTTFMQSPSVIFQLTGPSIRSPTLAPTVPHWESQVRVLSRGSSWHCILGPTLVPLGHTPSYSCTQIPVVPGTCHSLSFVLVEAVFCLETFQSPSWFSLSIPFWGDISQSTPYPCLQKMELDAGGRG